MPSTTPRNASVTPLRALPTPPPRPRSNLAGPWSIQSAQERHSATTMALMSRLGLTLHEALCVRRLLCDHAASSPECGSGWLGELTSHFLCHHILGLGGRVDPDRLMETCLALDILEERRGHIFISGFENHYPHQARQEAGRAAETAFFAREEKAKRTAQQRARRQAATPSPAPSEPRLQEGFKKASRTASSPQNMPSDAKFGKIPDMPLSLISDLLGERSDAVLSDKGKRPLGPGGPRGLSADHESVHEGGGPPQGPASPSSEDAPTPREEERVQQLSYAETARAPARTPAPAREEEGYWASLMDEANGTKRPRPAAKRKPAPQRAEWQKALPTRPPPKAPSPPAAPPPPPVSPPPPPKPTDAPPKPWDPAQAATEAKPNDGTGDDGRELSREEAAERMAALHAWVDKLSGPPKNRPQKRRGGP